MNILSDPSVLLSVLVFLPAVVALGLTLFLPPGQDETAKRISFAATLVVFAMSVLLIFGGEGLRFEAGVAEMQHAFAVPWIPSFGVDFFLGLDGISFPLVVLTTFLCMLAMGASWPIDRHVKAYCVLFLLLETGMLGVFLALDFFLFYVFWEVMLLPMYFLIGVWGGPRREYAAIKFFLYTLVGSVLMLVALLMLYFASDLTQLSANQLAAAHVIPSPERGADAGLVMQDWLTRDAPLAQQFAEAQQAGQPLHTFNILAMQQMGQHTELFHQPLLWGYTLQGWAFVLLLIGFLIKVPSVPLHTWLPDAHVEAPTPISMILAGVLLKMGGYGILRFCYPICPEAGRQLAWVVCTIGVVSMVWGALAALAQTDFKRLVAYSSVSHMGYVVLGLGVWSSLADGDYWKMGATGAMFQMIAHGISAAGMFFVVGVVYDRVHHRDLNRFGGLFGRMPIYSGLAVGLFFAGLGLPGLCGFIGEFFVVLATWPYSKPLAVVSASVVILTAGYILWTIQRVYLGAEYRGPHADALTPITSREAWIAAPLLALAIGLGVYPRALLDYMQPTIDAQIVDLMQSSAADKVAIATAIEPRAQLALRVADKASVPNPRRTPSAPVRSGAR